MTAIRFRRLAVLALFLAALPTLAIERVLLPVVFGGTGAPGAYGSVWRTFLTGYNDNDRYVRVVESLLPCNFECPVPPAPAHAFFRYDRYTPPGLGRYLYIGEASTTEAEVDALHLSLRAQDLSRQSQTWGTELPVVRERDYRNKVMLLDVPTTDEFRITLRIFVPNVEQDVVRVTVVRGGAALLDTSVVVTLPQPGYEEYPAQIALNDFAGLYPEIQGSEPVSIVVSGDQKLWAFASVTNNSTQHVTTASPR